VLVRHLYSRVLELISKTWSWGPSLIPSRPDRGRPIILGSGSCHAARYISFGWLTNRGLSDTHHHSKKDSISLCESDGMRHCLCIWPSSPVSCYFHYVGVASGSSATTSLVVWVSTSLSDRASAQGLFIQSLRPNPTSANPSWSTTIRSNNGIRAGLGFKLD
jgi:hypothetical protein